MSIKKIKIKKVLKSDLDLIENLRKSPTCDDQIVMGGSLFGNTEDLGVTKGQILNCDYFRKIYIDFIRMCHK